jgi:hypothetical protein
MAANANAERWLDGPVTGVPALLQPVAHALLQAAGEVSRTMKDFPPALLWQPLAGMASPGFHLQHMAGVLDRLFTYARGEMLSEEQMQYLKAEGIPPQHPYKLPDHEGEVKGSPDMLKMLDEIDSQPTELINHLRQRVNFCLVQLATTDPATLTDSRGVGRRQIPSTVIGLLTHAAEHTMRHTGQLLVTAAVLKEKSNQ